MLTQTERYATRYRRQPYDFDGLRCPFFYSTNGEILWFQDVGHPLNRSHCVAAFHTLQQ